MRNATASRTGTFQPHAHPHGGAPRQRPSALCLWGAWVGVCCGAERHSPISHAQCAQPQGLSAFFGWCLYFFRASERLGIWQWTDPGQGTPHIPLPFPTPTGWVRLFSPLPLPKKSTDTERFELSRASTSTERKLDPFGDSRLGLGRINPDALTTRPSVLFLKEWGSETKVLSIFFIKRNVRLNVSDFFSR